MVDACRACVMEHGARHGLSRRGHTFSTHGALRQRCAHGRARRVAKILSRWLGRSGAGNCAAFAPGKGRRWASCASAIGVYAGVQGRR